MSTAHKCGNREAIKIDYKYPRMDEITERARQSPFRERVRDRICNLRPQLFYLFVLLLPVLLLMLFSLLYLDPGSPSYVILMIDFIILIVTLVPLVAVLYLCSRQDQQW